MNPVDVVSAFILLFLSFWAVQRQYGDRGLLVVGLTVAALFLLVFLLPPWLQGRLVWG